MRSLNHRYLEFSLRLPEEFRVLEPAIRESLGKYLSRGKIDATLRFHPSPGAQGSGVKLNTDLTRGLLAMHAELEDLTGLKQDPGLATLLRWPGVVEEQLPDPAPLHEAALELLNEAAAELQSGRSREGEQTARAIDDRLDGIEKWVTDIRQWLPEIRTALREKILERVADLQQPLDPGRLEQEVSFLAQKIDVDEELDRLDSHVTETRRALQLDEPVGRRLDFLMQEFNREANTLCSKAQSKDLTAIGLDLKAVIDQMREQVQNIE